MHTVFTRSQGVIAALVSLVLLSGCHADTDKVFRPWSLLFLVIALLAAVPAVIGTRNYRRYRLRKKKERARHRDIRPMHPMIYAMYGIVLAGLVLFCLLCRTTVDAPSSGKSDEPTDTVSTTAASTAVTASPEGDPPSEGTPSATFSPVASSIGNPSQWGISWEIYNGSTQVPSHMRTAPIQFGDPASYFALPGIAAFRSDNYRSGSTYGTAAVQSRTVSKDWSIPTGSLTNADGTTWSGSGWTGQPLIVQWPASVRQIMNMYDEKKAKDGLAEVIYATLDGKIYFLDLADGSFTRDPLDIGMCFKGAGSLDPRGYPLLYVGSGDENEAGDHPRMFIISLIDGSVLFEYGHSDPLATRTDHDYWSAFDSSPLVCKATDTLVWPGENGLLYTMKLNTFYDPLGSTINVTPDAPLLTRYSTDRSNDETYWVGYEAGAVIVDHYLYISENGGMFYCIDLNTMSLVWAQDTKDDSNATPVFEQVSATQGYLYTAPSLHWTAEGGAGTISLYKLNAVTGEIVWEKPYDVHTVSGVSGGVQASPLLGKAGTTMEGLVLFAIARTPDTESGLLVALDTQTGDEVWRMDMTHYAWSSPVAVYGENGTAYVILCDSAGNLFFLDGQSGDILDTLSVGTMVEATPAVFGSKLIVGTKCQQICGLTVH